MTYNDLGRYLFVSMDKDSLVGSIYYEKGRIRLVHKYGPKVSWHDSTMYVLTPQPIKKGGYEEIKNAGLYYMFDILNKETQENYKILNCSHEELLDQLNPEFKKSHLVDVRNYTTFSDLYLSEFFFNDYHIVNGFHPSRGGAVYIRIEQNDRCFEDIYKIACRHGELAILPYNLMVYGAFEGYCKCYYDHKPFNIHSPYERGYL